MWAGFSSCTICLLASTLKETNSSHTIKPMKIYEKLKMICKHLVHGRGICEENFAIALREYTFSKKGDAGGYHFYRYR